ncbi:MAG: DJ-1/PfpI family protein [Metamycoplasmataceae bacterium]|uniref:DJ-1/PfpI family protein n=1 Tax=Mycoplasmopsis lipophila TaxID=2117 RepID=UPI0038732B98
MKLLVLVHPYFNDIELTTTISCLQKAKLLELITYYNPKHIQATGQYNVVTLNLSNEVDFNQYDALFIPGGVGAKELRNDEKSLAVIDKFIIDKKDIFAICDAPNVLQENGYLEKLEYSSFPIEGLELEKLNNRKEDMVTVSNNFITGKCAAAAMEFGLKIIKEKSSENDSEAVRRAMFGIK